LRPLDARRSRTGQEFRKGDRLARRGFVNLWDRGWLWLNAYHANLRGPTCLAKRNAVLHTRFAFCAGMGHRNSRYPSAESRSKEPSCSHGGATGVPAHGRCAPGAFCSTRAKSCPCFRHGSARTPARSRFPCFSLAEKWPPGAGSAWYPLSTRWWDRCFART
jgi:hypothetical protein